MPQLSPSRPQHIHADRKSARAVPTIHHQSSSRQSPEYPAGRILTNLPATITTRRPASPTRRQRQDQTFNGAITLHPDTSVPPPKAVASNAQTNMVDGSQRFFCASQGLPLVSTIKKDVIGPKKPSFHTTTSFSGVSSIRQSPGGLRRSESAVDTTIINKSNPSKTSSTTNTTPVIRPRLDQRLEMHKKSPSATETHSPMLNAHGVISVAKARPLSTSDVLKRPRNSSQSSVVSADARSVVSRRSSEQIKANPNIMPITTHTMVSSLPTDDELDTPSAVYDYGRTITPTTTSKTNPSPVGTAANIPSLAMPEDSTLAPSLPGSPESPGQLSQTSRKIMDLEIRNMSLLSVNNQIEKRSRDQAQELKELRRRVAQMTQTPYLRYANGNDKEDDFFSLGWHQDLEGLGVGASISASTSASAPDDKFQDVADALLFAAQNVDESIRRSLMLAEHLLEDAKRGLAYRPRDSEILGRRVLVNRTPDDSHVFEDDENEDENEDEDADADGELDGVGVLEGNLTSGSQSSVPADFLDEHQTDASKDILSHG